jgi:hypothetical protein
VKGYVGASAFAAGATTALAKRMAGFATEGQP